MEKCGDNYCFKGSSMIYKEKLIDAMNYQEYLDKIYALLEDNKSTGHDHSEAMIHYTRMNMRRMERWNKTIKLIPKVRSYFQSIGKKIEFLIITEAWCGDAAHLMPLIQKIVDVNPNFSIKTILRDEHPEIMNQYLTNGSKSIPIVVAFQIIDEQYIELFSWGPKPIPMMQKLKDFKEGKSNIVKGIFLKETQMWYNQDKTITIQKELLELMKASLMA